MGLWARVGSRERTMAIDVDYGKRVYSKSKCTLATAMDTGHCIRKEGKKRREQGEEERGLL